MCGLVGVAGRISSQVRNSVFKDMLDVCQTRGRDATGVIKVDEDGDYDWVKNVGPPAYLFDRRIYSNMMDTGNATVLIGHTRHKTAGGNDVASAHPFDYPEENIVGVHNGTLKSYHGLDTYNYKKVDSEVLYGHLAKNGPEETFNTIEGAWACVWWDDTSKTVNFTRNTERPLWFTWSKDSDMMFWASELWMFSAISRKVDLWDGDKDGNRFVNLPPETLWSFSIDPKAKKEDHVITMKAPVKIPAKKPPPIVNTSGGYHGNNSWTKNNQGTHVRNKPFVPKKNETPAKGGKVADPFLKKNDPLEDDVSDIGQGQESLIIPITNVAYIRDSSKPSESQTVSKDTKPSSKRTLSLVENPSQPTPPENKDDGTTKLLKSPSKLSISPNSRLRSGVSLRTVAGEEYITDNVTGSEFISTVFDENTGGCCSFCSKPVGALKEVALFVNEKSFICKSCIVAPVAMSY